MTAQRGSVWRMGVIWGKLCCLAKDCDGMGAGPRWFIGARVFSSGFKLKDKSMHDTLLYFLDIFGWKNGYPHLRMAMTFT